MGSSLTFSMVASSDTSYTTHTTFACEGQSGAQHYPRLSVHATLALTGRAGRGSETQEAILPRYPSASAPWPAMSLGLVLSSSNLRPVLPCSLLGPTTAALVSPLKDSGKTQPPPNLGTPALAVALLSCITVGRGDDELNSI